MSKFNTKKEPSVPSEINLMGERAYKLDPREELVATVLTTFVQKSYYESEKEVLNRIKKAMEECDPLFIAKLALYTRNEANMRSSSHVISAELASRAAGKEWARRFYQKVSVRPDDMSEIIAYYKNIMKQKKLSNAMREGFKKKLEGMDPYLIDKYKMKGRDLSLIDLVNLLHPIPTKKNEEAFKLLMTQGGKGLDKLYSSKIFEKEMSKTGKVEGNVDEAKKEAITSILENTAGMPIFNLLRNLRNIILYAPNKIDDAISQLTNPEKIKNSRLLPFRFLSAYNEISKMVYGGKNTDSGIVFEDEIQGSLVTKDVFDGGKKKVLNAVENAIELSCINIPTLEGRTAILIDHSGSMRGDGGGHSLVSALSTTRSSDIANVFASMLLRFQPSVYVGLFGDRLVGFDVKREEGILATAHRIHELGSSCGGSTEAGIYEFFNNIINNQKRIDNIIIFSDMVIGDGCGWYGHSDETRGGNFKNLFKKFRSMYPITKVVSVDIKQTQGTSVFNKNYGVTQVAGWSDKIFDVISAGTIGYKALIEEINKIEI
jgi:60 kDa SS-A/Ro ribonucleoprotein